MHGIVNAITDPVGSLLQGITAVLAHFVDKARDDVTASLDRYLFQTVDLTRPGERPLTANPTLMHLNGGLMVAGDVLIAAVIAFASLRSMFEHRGLRPHYTLKVILPRVLLAVVLGHGSMLFMQMGIDLNNALCHVALALGGPGDGQSLPWADVMSNAAVHRLQLGQDLFHAIFAVAVVVAVVILLLAYVIRGALLNLLVVTAPLAALCSILPETLGHSRSWLRLFTAALFMQAVQLIVLRVAVVTAFDKSGGITSDLYSLATLWIMLKVPGALNTAEHLGTKAHTMGHNLEKAVRRALVPHAAHRSHAA